MQPYYKDVYGYLRVGPPLLLVVKDINMSRHAEDIDAVCSIAGCRDDSLLSQVWLVLGQTVCHGSSSHLWSSSGVAYMGPVQVEMSYVTMEHSKCYLLTI